MADFCLKEEYLVVSRVVENKTLKGYLVVEVYNQATSVFELARIRVIGPTTKFVNAEYDPLYGGLEGSNGAPIAGYPSISTDFKLTSKNAIIILFVVTDKDTGKPAGVVAFNGIGARYTITFPKLKQLASRFECANFKFVLDSEHGEIPVHKDGTPFETVQMVTRQRRAEINEIYRGNSITQASIADLPKLAVTTFVDEMTKEFDQEAQVKMVQAMVNMQELTPYYYTLFCSLTRKPAPGLQTLAVTEDTLFYDMQFVASLAIPELSFILIHEVLHVMYQHSVRFEGRLNHNLWNIACDLYINSIICNDFDIKYGGGVRKFKNTESNVECQIKTPEIGIFIETIGETIDLNKDTPETIYDRLVKENPQMSMPQNGNSNKPQSKQNGQGNNQGQGQGQGGQNGGQQGSQSGDSGGQTGQSGVTSGMQKVNEGLQQAKGNSPGADPSSMKSGESKLRQGAKKVSQGLAEGNMGKVKEGLSQMQQGVDQMQSGGADQGACNKMSEGIKEIGDGANQSGQNGQNGQNGQGNQGNQGNQSGQSSQGSQGGQSSQGSQGSTTGGSKDVSSQLQQNASSGQIGIDNLGSNISQNRIEEVEVTFRGKKLKGRMMVDIMSSQSTDTEEGRHKMRENSRTALQRASTKKKMVEEELGHPLEQGAGAGASLTSRYIEFGLSEGIRWEVLLKNICKTRPRKTFTLAQPNVDYMNMGVTLADRRAIGRPEYLSAIKFGVDVSGSVGKEDLEHILSEINNIFRKFKLDGELIYWSTMVGGAGRFSNMRDMLKITPASTGGTDVSCLFDYLAGETKVDNKAEPDKPKDMKAIFIFTDGHFSENYANYKAMFGRKVVWIITGDAMHFNPPFGRVVQYDYQV